MSHIIQERSAARVKPVVADTASPAVAHHKPPLGLQTVAMFEFLKGFIVLIAGLGLLSLIHRDAQQISEQIVALMGMDPAHEFPRIFIEAASRLTDAKLWFYSVAALMYSTVRFVEAYGLWHELPWAEWFAVISAGLWLPFELYHLWEKPSIVSLAVPVINIGIVIYLARLLMHESAKKSHPDPGL